MKKCPNCGAQIDDNSLFCTECGKQIPQGNVCPHCGASVSDGDAFCQSCGNKVDGVEEQQPSAAAAPAQKRCPHCGAMVGSDSVFCENCGRNVSNGSSAPNTNFQTQAPYAPKSNSQNTMILPIVIGGILFVALILAGGGWWYYKYSKPKTSDYAITLNDNDSIAEIQEPEIDETVEEIADEMVGDSLNADNFVVVEADDDFVDAESPTTRYDKSEDNTALAREETREHEEVQAHQSETSNKVYDVAEQMPQFPGGPQALFEYLSRNIKYPVEAEENGIQGRVVVSIVIERDGSVSDVKVVKSVAPSLDKEAVRVISSMPKWIPGKQNGSAVRVKYTMPVTFSLQ